MKILSRLLILLSMTAFSSTAAAREVIVARDNDSVAVFFRLPYADVAPLFGQEVKGFTDEAGNFSREKLFNGTFERADALAADVTFDLGSQSVGFEALSMMIHQTETVLPFDSPLDAEIAIAVCGVPFPDGPLLPDDIVWVGGWYAYPVDADQALTINLPHTGRGAQELTVKTFDNGQFEDAIEVTVADGGAINVPTASTWSWLGFGG